MKRIIFLTIAFVIFLCGFAHAVQLDFEIVPDTPTSGTDGLLFNVSAEDNSDLISLHTMSFRIETSELEQPPFHSFTFDENGGLLSVPVALEDYGWESDEYKHFSGIIIYEVPQEDGFVEVERISSTNFVARVHQPDLGMSVHTFHLKTEEFFELRDVSVAANPTNPNQIQLDFALVNTGDNRINSTSLTTTVSGDFTPVPEPSIPPRYTGILVFGDYYARLIGTRNYYYWWGSRAELPPARVEIIPRSEDPDLASPVATIMLPSRACIYQVGDLLVTATMEIQDSSDYPYTYETSIEVWDLGEPTAPEYRGHLTTERLRPDFPLRRRDDSNNVRSVPGGLVFLQKNGQGQRLSLEVLDLSNLTAPSFAESIDMGSGNKRVSMLVDGSNAWISYRRRPRDTATDQIFPPYYIKKVNLAVISRPQVEEPINVPGTLLAIEGNNIYTKETVWGEETVETAIARLEVFDGLAYLQAEQRFMDQIVEDIALDGEGHVLVSHRLHLDLLPQHSMTVLVRNNLEVLATIPVAERAKLIAAPPGRAAFLVPGGLFIINLDNPAAPFPQAYFTTSGRLLGILVDEDRIIFAAGRFGIFVFDLDEFNLLPPVTCTDDIDCGCNGKLVACSEFTATECDRQLGCGWDTIALYCIPNDAHTFDECADLSLDQCNGRSDCYTMSCDEGVCQ